MFLENNSFNVFGTFKSKTDRNTTLYSTSEIKVRPDLLQRTPKKDEVIKNGAKTLSKSQKNILLGIGTAGIALAGLLFGHGVNKSNQAKELEKIEVKFNELEQNLPEVKKNFSEVFMREDITDEEALEMLHRYKEIKKIGVTGTKEEYAQAMFEEGKKNFGLSHLPSELTLVDKPIRGDERILGITDPLGNIQIKSTIRNSHLSDTIHHELRHLKQHYYAYNLSPDEYVKASQPKNTTIPKEAFDFAFGGEANIDNIPPEHMEFAENSLKSTLSYKSILKNEQGYFAQWAEIDAYKTGQQINALLRH